MKTRHSTALLLLSLLFAHSGLAQTDRLDEARRYLVRGTAAVEIAKTPDDLEAAAREFRTATQLAPGLAAAWFNLGFVETKQSHYGEAIEAYRRYLQLSPQADDAAKIGNEIIKLEYLHERSQAKARLAGTWVMPRAAGEVADAYKIRFDDDKLVMIDASRSWLSREIALYTDKRERDRENSFKASGGQLIFMGRIVGDRIVGERIQPATIISLDEEEPLCRLRELRTPFEARLSDDGATLTLSFTEPRYRLYWHYIGSFLGLGNSKTCGTIEEAAGENAVLNLVRQQPLPAAAGRPAGEARPKGARDYLVRGGLALDAAKSDDDLIAAEAEFRKATEADPQLAEGWYNLGLLYAKLKRYPDAVAAYRKYLAIRPTAENARQIEDEITRLNYFQERKPEPPKPGWAFLARNTSGNREGDTVYIDKSTISTQHGISSVAVLWDFAKPPAGGWDFWSTKEVHEINCGARQGRRVSVEAYEEHMGKGKLLHQYAKPDQNYYPATPGTLGQIFIDAVCR